MQEQNRRISLKQYPVEITDEHTFSLEPIPIAEPNEGEVLVRTLYLSIEPYMRNLITGIEGNYRQFKIGETIISARLYPSGSVAEQVRPTVEESLWDIYRIRFSNRQMKKSKLPQLLTHQG